MEVTILGSGTAMPVHNHSPAGILLQHGNEVFLVDAGPGTLSRLSRHGISPDRLQTLFLTHFHPDHSLDLATILQVFDSNPAGPRRDPFFIFGGPGTNQFFKRMLALYPDIKPQTYSITIHEVFRDRIEFSNLVIQTAPSGHTKNSLSYRFENNEGSLVISGDASERGELAALSAGADVLVCECSFPSGWNTEDHLNADAVARLAVKSGAKRLVLTHLYPPALAANVAEQVGHTYHGTLTLATDGLNFTVQGERKCL